MVGHETRSGWAGAGCAEVRGGQLKPLGRSPLPPRTAVGLPAVLAQPSGLGVARTVPDSDRQASRTSRTRSDMACLASPKNIEVLSK